ncbi:MAG: DUF1847 domain-containing protein [Deltaproteobacteria bacterium]|nr:DUF1847 domain-containing protein [Deltaproteobacteria bacterium]
MAKDKNSIMCGSCTKFECKINYPEGIPAWCAATSFRAALESTKQEYATPNNLEIYRAAAKVIQSDYGKWTRIKEAIEFAKELKLEKIGLASCVALLSELGLVAKLFTGAGFEVVSSACQIGKVSPEERGVAFDSTDHRGLTCNPIAQAEICNQAGTQLNFLLGLCLGHDILFTRRSQAPVSTLIVKDRVTGHNPAAALYADPLRQSLFKTYCKK